MTSLPPRRQVWRAFVSGGFGLAITAQVTFIVPVRARELGASFDVIGLIVAAGALAPAILSVPLGSMIDRFGPRRSFIFGTTCVAAIAAMFVVATSYWWLLVLQPALGIARTIGWLASQSYITSLATDATRPRLTGRFAFFAMGGQMLGPLLIGGAAELIGFRWAFLVLAGYATIFALLGWALVEIRRTGHEDRAKQGVGLRSALELLRVRGIQFALLLTFACLWTTWLYLTFFPVFLIDSGVQPAVVGVVMATSGLVATLLGPTSGFWTRRRSPLAVTTVALATSVLGILLAPHVTGLPAAFVVPIMVGVGQGLTLPLLLNIVASAAPPEKRGVALGLRAMTNQSAATMAPMFVGPLIAGFGILVGFTAGGLAAAAILAGSRLLHVLDRREQAGRQAQR